MFEELDRPGGALARHRARRSSPTASPSTPPTGSGPPGSSSTRTATSSPTGAASSRRPSSPGSGGLRPRPTPGWRVRASCSRRPSPAPDGVLQVTVAPVTSRACSTPRSPPPSSRTTPPRTSSSPRTARRRRSATTSARAPIRAGEPVIVDIWPRDNRSACFTDMTRTFVAGRPHPGGRRMAPALRRVARARAGPGTPRRDREVGLRRGLRAGRGRGLPDAADEGRRRDPRERVHLRARPRRRARGARAAVPRHARPHALVAGDVLALEPDLCRAGDYGVRVEDLVLVTEDGCEKLGGFPYDLVV